MTFLRIYMHVRTVYLVRSGTQNGRCFGESLPFATLNARGEYGLRNPSPDGQWICFSAFLLRILIQHLIVTSVIDDLVFFDWLFGIHLHHRIPLVFFRSAMRIRPFDMGSERSGRLLGFVSDGNSIAPS